jgi:hypothetical protein
MEAAMTMTNESVENVEQRIAVRAYEMWMGRGAPISDGKDDWFAARVAIEAELAVPRQSPSASPAKRKAKVAKSQTSTPSRTRAKSEARRAQA